MIVALSGYGQTGKDTAAAFMSEFAFSRLAFADPLKAVALACDPVFEVFAGTATGRNEFGESVHKTLKVRRALSRLIQDGGWEWAKSFCPESRIFLQHLGVGVREHVDPDAWVNALFRQCEPGRRYVITDCRFPNEAAAVKARGGLVVRIHRPGVGAVNAHASETALDDWDFDAHLFNDGDLEHYRARVHLFLAEEGLI